MSDGGTGEMFFVMLAMCVIIGFASCSGGRDSGKLEGKCVAHAMYAKTPTDTLALAKAYPECAPTLFPERN